jgi:hypothetical protein
MCIVDDGANERVLCDLGEARRCQARRDGRVVERRWQRVLRCCWAAVEGGACAPGVLDGAFVVHLRSEAEAEAAHVLRSAMGSRFGDVAEDRPHHEPDCLLFARLRWGSDPTVMVYQMSNTGL